MKGSKKMKAVILDGFGGREVLKIGEVDRPSPQSGQVLIKIMATSVNRADIVQREGNYPPPKGESEIMGLEVAGVVEEVGPNVSGWKPGDRVMTLVGGGGYAQYAVAYADHLIAIPDNMTFTEAACVCEVYITAYLNIFMLGAFKDSETILLHGGGGGVNTAGIQLCRSLTPNSKVIVTASPGKVDRVKELGADLVINYKEQDFANEIESYTQGNGVDVILDHVGEQYFSRNIQSLAIYGRLILIAVISGAKAEFNIAQVMVKRQKIMGSVLRARPVAEKAEIVNQFSQIVMPKLTDKTFYPIIHKVFPLEDAAEAQRTMEESLHFGKIVIEVSH